AVRTIKFPVVSSMKRITDMKQEYFVANYYGINPFSASQKYVVVLATNIKYSLPLHNDVATIGIVDIETAKFHSLSQTRAWNFQEGCMAHWLPTAPDSEIIFNDFIEGKNVARIINIHSGKERIICRPVSSISPEGKKAVSLNYSRRRLTRPDYGYDGEGEDSRADIPFPDDDGLYIVDLQKNTSALIVSIAEVKKLIGKPDIKNKKALMWFAHTLFNKDGSRIFFLARIRESIKTGIFTASLTVDSDGKNLSPCFPEPWKWGGSHYDWYSKDILMVTAAYQGKRWGPVIFTVGKQDYRLIGKGLFEDGHGTFSPDGRYMAMDTYPDSIGNQGLYLVDMKTDAVLPLAQLYEPSEYYTPLSYWRCDLHPHWSPRGDILLVNSTHENKRQVYAFTLGL
ncbi:MAG TPA: hypothetical protein PLQ41_09170, partial [bacterium]|nr:hypothetical protein [bacterium]